MVSKKRSQVEITCPKCTEQGVVRFSENTDQSSNKFNNQIDSIDGNFTVTIMMSEDDDVEVTCESCGKELSL